MKHILPTLVAFCICSIAFPQENSLFSGEDQSFWDNLTIKKNDSSSLYKDLFNDKALAKSSFIFRDYQLNEKQKAFYKTENSAIKHATPIYKPKGNAIKNSLFPDNTIDHLLIIVPLKEY